jgi:SNF2 family DNA or RNA helicase
MSGAGSFRDRFIAAAAARSTPITRHRFQVPGLEPEQIFSPPSSLESQQQEQAEIEDVAEERSPLKRAEEEDDFKEASFSPSKRFRGAGERAGLADPPEGHTDAVLDEEVPQMAIPAALAYQLRPYQMEGVRFMYRRWREDLGAILGDDMVKRLLVSPPLSYCDVLCC